MKLAVITDVHADAHALQHALTQIDRLGIELVVCAGDLIDYGLFEEETLALLRARKIPTVRGNHDRWAVGPTTDAARWHLSKPAVRQLVALPASWSRTLAGTRVAVTHASWGDDMAGIPRDASDDELALQLDLAQADVLLVGHTHRPFVRTLPDGRVVANPGALLRDPADGTDVPSPGTFGVLDGATRTFTVHRAADGSAVRLKSGRRPFTLERGD